MSDSIIYVVRRCVKSEYGLDDIPDPSQQYVAAFDSESEATSAARRLERAEISLRGTARNLFQRGISEMTSCSEGEFRKWLQKENIAPPKRDEPDAWREWWVQMVQFQGGCLTAGQFRHLLEGMDRIPLQNFEVISTSRETQIERSTDIGYAVVHKQWLFDDSHFCGSNDVLSVYRSRETAEAERLRRMRQSEADAERAKRNRNYDWRDGPDEYVVVEILLNEEG